MGLFNKLIDKSKSRMEELDRINEKQENEFGLELTIKAGKNYITNSLFNSVDMWQQEDGYIYFDTNDSDLYEFLGYTWEGPRYQTITVSKTKGKDKTKTKRKGRLLGTAVGAMINPAGAVIGFLVGTGNKDIKGKNSSKTVAKERQEEVATSATIRLRSKETKEIISIVVECDTETNNDLSMFLQTSEVANPTATKVDDDSYAELKKMKELLDMGIISQEEFDQKKKAILNL